MAMNQRFDHACWAVFIAMVLDSLDGRVARLTNTQSEFGAQYDSLSDMVSFGAAPALVIYEWSLRGLGKLGWIAAFVYCAGAALRLARFNTNIEVVDKRFFQGLPSPAAAALVVGFVMMMTDPDINIGARKVDWISWGIALFAGLTMVTNVPFYSFKDVNFRKSVPFIVVFLIALGLALLAIDPPQVSCGRCSCVYGLSGYAVYLLAPGQGQAGQHHPDRRGAGRPERAALSALRLARARRSRAPPPAAAARSACALFALDLRAEALRAGRPGLAAGSLAGSSMPS